MAEPLAFKPAGGKQQQWTMRMLLRSLLALLCWTALHTHALAPANPHGWEEEQPDGSKAGRLYLKGHPSTHVHVVDQHHHPVIRDKDGWIVYATPHINGTIPNVHERRRRRQLWKPTPYRVSPNSRPPRHLKQQLLNGFEPPSEQDGTDEMQCADQSKSPWCLSRPPRMSRTFDDPLNKGTTRVIVVLVRFSDHSTRPMPPRQDYDTLFNSRGKDDVIAPTGSVDEFFRLQSLNQYRIIADVQPWITAPQSEEYYSYGQFGLTSLYAKVAYEALDRMDRQGVNWSQYDRDNDGVLDSVVILHSGFAAEGGGTDCINKRDLGTHRIWSHRTSVGDNRDAWRSSDENFRIGRYATASAVHGYCGYNITRIGVVGHEMIHMLGLPDLLGKEAAGIGIYDVMGMMWGMDGTQRYPATLSTWSRNQLKWVTPTLISTSGTYTLRASQLHHDAFRIDLRDGEYLLLENRQKQLLDARMPNDGGILIWHIDENMEREWMSSPGFPGQSGWPGNGNHFQVALVQPDGRYDLEKNRNYGDEADCWCSNCWANDLILEPGPARSQALEGSYDRYPNTDTYTNGTIRKTGITIYDFSPVGPTMSFKVSFGGDPVTQPPTPNPTPFPTRTPLTLSPTPFPTPQPTERPTSVPVPPPTPLPTRTPLTVPPTASPTPLPTRFPTWAPTGSPTERPTALPTRTPLTWPPTVSPTRLPTEAPVPPPTPLPTRTPLTLNPTASPTQPPTRFPTWSPTGSPTEDPTASPVPPPTLLPTRTPLTLQPTGAPSDSPTITPVADPTAPPTRRAITMSPTIDIATESPTRETPQPSEIVTPSPTVATPRPTSSPTWSPTSLPTPVPSDQPSPSPSEAPVPVTASPTIQATMSPTLSNEEIWTPTVAPTKEITIAEFRPPSVELYQGITMSPTIDLTTESPTIDVADDIQTESPTNGPTDAPTESPSDSPTTPPSDMPSSSPSDLPSTAPSLSPTTSQMPTVSLQPSLAPTDSKSPSAAPSGTPSSHPSDMPSVQPSPSPSDQPSSKPTSSPYPSSAPSAEPSVSPTDRPTSSPTSPPTWPPTATPSDAPSASPTDFPTEYPTFSPTSPPTDSPSKSPTNQPSPRPTPRPTERPTPFPTNETIEPTSEVDGAAFNGINYIRRPFNYLRENAGI